MKLELRAIKLHKGLSEETPAYTAAVYFDGEKACEVSNSGHGGCDSVRWMSPRLSGLVSAHFASLPPIFYKDGLTLHPNLELWCHTEVWAQDEIKRMRGKLRKVVLLYRDDAIYEIKANPVQLDTRMNTGSTFRESILLNNPGGVILNDAPGEAFENIVRKYMNMEK